MLAKWIKGNWIYVQPMETKTATLCRSRKAKAQGTKICVSAFVALLTYFYFIFHRNLIFVLNSKRITAVGNLPFITMNSAWKYSEIMHESVLYFIFMWHKNPHNETNILIFRTYSYKLKTKLNKYICHYLKKKRKNIVHAFYFFLLVTPDLF